MHTCTLIVNEIRLIKNLEEVEETWSLLSIFGYGSQFTENKIDMTSRSKPSSNSTTLHIYT